MNNTENRFKCEGVWYITIKQDGSRNCAFSDKKRSAALTTKLFQHVMSLKEKTGAM